MKKRNCRMSNTEKATHDFAVRVRKMTDQQLYDFVNSPPANADKIEDFINKIEHRAVYGIGTATIRKIKEFAIKEGFIIEN